MDAGCDHFQHLMWWHAVSKGLRYVPATFDHYHFINSGFITEGLGPLVRGSLCIIIIHNPIMVFNTIKPYQLTKNHLINQGRNAIMTLCVSPVILYFWYANKTTVVKSFKMVSSFICLSCSPVNIHSRVPIIWPSVIQHSVLFNVLCRNAPSYQQSTRHAVEWITLPPHTFYIICTQLLQTYYCSGTGMTLPQRNGRRLRSKYPLLPNFFTNKLFHL
jgi:hypothetical protein